MFAIGRPIDALNPSSRDIDTHVEYVVLSDGPYRLHTRSTPLRAKIRSTNSFRSTSPARFTTRVLG